MGILSIVIIGFIAGLIARFLAPGPNNPAGFFVTTAIEIAGALSRPISARPSAGTGWTRVQASLAQRWARSRSCLYGIGWSSTAPSPTWETGGTLQGPVRAAGYSFRQAAVVVYRSSPPAKLGPPS